MSIRKLTIVTLICAFALVLLPGQAFAQEYRELRSRATGQCLAADFSAIYTYGCGVSNQRWSREYLGGPTGQFQMRNLATNLCIANSGTRNVRMVSCALNIDGERWETRTIYGQSYYFNRGVDQFLCTDYSRTVYLFGVVQNQGWVW